MKKRETLEDLAFFLSILNPASTDEEKAEKILAHIEEAGMVPEYIEAWGNHWEDE